MPSTCASRFLAGRLYTERPDYYRVLLFPTARALQAHLPAWLRGPRADIVAFCDYAPEGRCLGTLYFVAPIPVEDAAHECLHAVLCWGRGRRMNPERMTRYQHPTHERLATVHGRMVSRLLRLAEKRIPKSLTGDRHRP